MSNIQSGINQFLSKAAILGRLAPGFEERQENYKLGKEQKVLGKEYKQSFKGLKESGYGEKEFEQIQKTGNKMIDLSERQFQNKPTEKNYKRMLDLKKNYIETEEAYNNLKNIREQLKAVMQEQAQDKAAQQLQQKMSFDKFKKQLTVKDLPQNLQERAYNEYTSEE